MTKIFNKEFEEASLPDLHQSIIANLTRQNRFRDFEREYFEQSVDGFTLRYFFIDEFKEAESLVKDYHKVYRQKILHLIKLEKQKLVEAEKLAQVKVSQVVVRLPCGHLIHRRWKRQLERQECPFCRASFTKKAVSYMPPDPKCHENCCVFRRILGRDENKKLQRKRVKNLLEEDLVIKQKKRRFI